MSPAQHQGWRVLLDLAKIFPAGWCLVGGQMVWLLAADHGVDPPRATDDVDLVVDGSVGIQFQGDSVGTWAAPSWSI